MEEIVKQQVIRWLERVGAELDNSDLDEAHSAANTVRALEDCLFQYGYKKLDGFLVEDDASISQRIDHWRDVKKV